MTSVQETTKNERRVTIQKSNICNYGRARYRLANAVQGESGYTLSENFKNAIRSLPSSYSATEYTQFIDDWGTVSS